MMVLAGLVNTNSHYNHPGNHQPGPTQQFSGFILADEENYSINLDQHSNLVALF